jgi:hypothetical protein
MSDVAIRGAAPGGRVEIARLMEEMKARFYERLGYEQSSIRLGKDLAE